MTMLSYLFGWSAGSKVLGIARAPSGYAWNVNLDDGNSNRNHQSNHNYVRAVCASECHKPVSFRALYAAWRAARRGKKPSADQLTFDADWANQLLELEQQLKACTWTPSAPMCFVQLTPKAREIHAPAFADRVVHHLVVPILERLYEPTFIHDSYSNREGKGTHVAVDRLQSFLRQVHSGQRGGWYLQIDIKNYFVSIHRPTLYRMLKTRMERADVALCIRRAVHALLNYPISRTGVTYACKESERAAVPAYKRLENAAPGCGIAIGNLSSQFFANVYLDALDQYSKHTLKIERYVRYVDDVVVIHQDREQLLVWLEQIRSFLKEHLQLELKSEVKLKPLASGIDFLGYIIKPTHRVIRRRVIHHAIEKLAKWGKAHIRRDSVCATPAEFREIQSIWASYVGHFTHAASYRLIGRLHARFPWLAVAIRPRTFDYRLEHKALSIPRFKGER